MTLSAATDKQRQTLEAVVKAGSIKEGAKLLNIKEVTARTRLWQMYRRCDIKGLGQAAYLLGQERRN